MQKITSGYKFDVNSLVNDIKKKLYSNSEIETDGLYKVIINNFANDIKDIVVDNNYDITEVDIIVDISYTRIQLFSDLYLDIINKEGDLIDCIEIGFSLMRMLNYNDFTYDICNPSILWILNS